MVSTSANYLHFLWRESCADLAWQRVSRRTPEFESVGNRVLRIVRPYVLVKASLSVTAKGCVVHGPDAEHHLSCEPSRDSLLRQNIA